MAKDLFVELKETAIRQSVEGEFPDWLLAEVLAIADAPHRHEALRPLVATLIEQIDDYDPFAGAGCFGEAVGIETLQATIARIKSL